MQDPVEPDSFWVNPFGVAWPLLKASDLIRVNKDGKVVDGGKVRLLNTAGSSPISFYTQAFLTCKSIHDPSRRAHCTP